ncbi:methylmalonyl-CoA carboxyltransferase [Sphingomonas sp. ABOLG]|uniref:carboxyl transferase domain-containing protein n=1 Tax=Sphingomonas sp. ABOLG TaxID=1985880 RepID=UPI000F7EEAC1|nr:carboxyl transferase domain-containing protein [Sphingomonas sp. ABOLG]RSV18194.1 methylmalonyl-CoA carboxyltransferase [Sphingomonas sp. ABOLG]
MSGAAGEGHRPPDPLRARFAAAAAQHERHRLAACERLDTLFDEGTMMPIAVGAGVITAAGLVGGQRVMAFAQDVTDQGGIATADQAAHIAELLARAQAAQVPVVGLYDSGGLALDEAQAALAGQATILHALANGGRRRVPHLALVFGDAIGAAAFAPAMAHLTFMLERASRLYVSGPDVLRDATGELATAEALGGAMLQATTSGIADRIFANEIELLFAARMAIGLLVRDVAPSVDPATRVAAHLDTLVPADPAEPYDMRELVQAICDDRAWLELQPDRGGGMLCGIARIGGRSIGIMANQPIVAGGVIDRAGIAKATRLAALCATCRLPIVTLVDSPGLMPGAQEEAGGIVAAGAALLATVARADVPVITVVTRRATGPAWLMMAPRGAGGARFAWPTAEIAAMNAAGAARLLLRHGDDAATREKVRDYAASIADPVNAVASGIVDAVIRPADTRGAIALALARHDAQGSGRSLPHPDPQGSGTLKERDRNG